MKGFNNQFGQTLIEAIVVVSVAVLLVTGLISVTTTSLSTVQAGRIRTQSVSYAREAIEITRSVRDQDWVAFEAMDGMYCLGSDRLLTASPPQNCAANLPSAEGTLTRTVTFDWQDPTMVVTVDVTYPYRDTTKTVSLVTYLTEWK